MATTEELLFVLRMQDQASSQMLAFARSVTTTGNAAKETRGSLADMGRALSGVAVAVGAMVSANAVLRNTLGVYREYELGLANVQKVSGIAGDQMQQFSADFDELARRIPLPIAKLQELAYTAGSLGVQGTKNILAITEAMAKLGTTTNVQGEKGTLAVTQLLNVMHEAPTEAGRLGNQLVALDNTTAATGLSIVQMASRIGQATSYFDIGSGRALAFGAAIAALGARAERGGTTVGKVFLQLDQATRGAANASKALKDLELLFGQSQQQLRAAFQADPGQFFVDFIGKLQQVEKSGANYFTLLRDMNLQQAETNATLLPLANHASDLARNLRIVGEQARLGTAQGREFDIFLQTLDSRSKLLSNDMQLLGKDIGAALGGEAKGAVTGFTSVINELDEVFKGLPPHWQTLIANELTLVSALGAGAVAVGALRQAFTLLNIAALINPWTLLITAIAGTAAAILAFNNNARPAIELTQDETNRLVELTSGSNSAAAALQNLSRAEAQAMSIALDQKIEETTGRIKDLQFAAESGLKGWSYYANRIVGYGDTAGAAIMKLHGDMQAGRITTQQYGDALANMAEHGSGAAKNLAVNALNAQANLTHLQSDLDRYKTAQQQLGDASKYPVNPPKPAAPAAPPGPAPTADTKFQGDIPKPKRSNEAHEQEQQDFLREIQERIEGYQRETAALNVSTAAFDQQQRKERENSEVETQLKRGLDLHIKGIQDLAAAYRASLEARDTAQDKAAAADVVADVNKRIDAWQREGAAIAKGKEAWKEYRLEAQIDPEIEAFSRRLEQLGVEKSKVDELAAAYRQAGLAHAKQVDAAEQANQTNRDSARIADQLTDAIGKFAETSLSGSHNFTQAADEFVRSIEKMILEVAILDPLKKELQQIFGSGQQAANDNQATGGSGSGSSGGQGGGGGLTLGGIASGVGSAVGNAFNSFFGGGNNNQAAATPSATQQVANTANIVRSGSLAAAYTTTPTAPPQPQAPTSTSGGGASRSGGDGSAGGGAGGGNAAGFGSDGLLGWGEKAVQSSLNSMASQGVSDILKPAANWLGNTASSAASGLWSMIFHQGGTVGLGAPTRYMSASDFMNAPRYHTGLGADEFAAVLQRGERVMTANQNDRAVGAMSALADHVTRTAAAGGGGHTLNFNISTPDANSFRASQGQIMSRASSSLATASRRNGAPS